MSYKGKYSKHQVIFEDEYMKELEQFYNIMTDTDLDMQQIENYNPLYAPVIARIMCEMNMSERFSNAQQYTLRKGLIKFGKRRENARFIVVKRRAAVVLMAFPNHHQLEPSVDAISYSGLRRKSIKI